MGLNGHQARHHYQNKCVGQNAVAEAAHFVLFPGNAVGKVGNDCHLGDLRGLELHADLQPPGSALGRHRDGVVGDDDQNQKNHGHIDQGSARAAKPLIVEFTDQQHHRRTQHGENALLFKVIQRVVAGGRFLIIGGGKAGGQEDHQTDGRQQHDQQTEGQVDGTFGQFPALFHFFPAALLALLKGQLLLMGQGTAARPCLGHGCFLLSESSQGLTGLQIAAPDAVIRQQAEHCRNGHKNRYDLHLAPAAPFQMVMQRGHFEKPLAMSGLEVSNLYNIG